MLKRTSFQYLFILALFVLPLGLSAAGFFGISSSTDVSLTVEERNTNRVKITAPSADFDISTFDSDSKISVARKISVNDWGAVTVTDKLSINVSSTFDLLDLTFPKSIASNLHFQSITAIDLTQENGSTLAPTFEGPVYSNTSDVGVFTIGFADTAVSEVNITVSFGLSGVITNQKVSLGSTADATLPYRFYAEGIFFAWYSLPITDYTFTAGTEVALGAQTVKNATVIPTASDVGEEMQFNRTTKTSLFKYNIQEIEDLNYTSLNSLGYNLANIGDTKFIPAYDETLKTNLTQDVQFDLYFEAARLEFVRVDSTIDINSWSKVYHTEIITVRHIGVSGANPGSNAYPGETVGGVQTASPIVLYYPALQDEIVDVSARDNWGNLSNSKLVFKAEQEGFSSNISAIKVIPRVALEPGNEYTFTLKYSIKNKATLTETSGVLSPAFNLSTPLMTMFNWTVRELNVNIIFPIFSSFSQKNIPFWNPDISKTGSSAGLLNLGRPTLRLSFYNATQAHNTVIDINFSLMPVVGWFIEPFVFMLLFFLLGAIVITIRALSQRFTPYVSTQKYEEVPFDLIEGFVRHYQEKTALRTRMTNLEKKRKNMKKGDYDMQLSTLQAKTSENDQELIKYTQSLINTGPRYREAIRAIELAEAEREDYLKNLIDLEQKKRQKRLRPEIYSRMREDYTRKLKKANSTIEQRLISLRDMLTEKQ